MKDHEIIEYLQNKGQGNIFTEELKVVKELVLEIAGKTQPTMIHIEQSNIESETHQRA